MSDNEILQEIIDSEGSCLCIKCEECPLGRTNKCCFSAGSEYTKAVAQRELEMLKHVEGV